LNEDIVVLMLLAVQKDNLNLQLSVKAALNRALPHIGSKVKHMVRECLFPFPNVWASVDHDTCLMMLD